MKLEEEESGKNEKSNGANSTANRLGGQELISDHSAGKSLKNKVIDILDALQDNAKDATAAMERASFNSSSALDMSMPLPTATDGFQALDVLPVLSNDPSCNFWQFLDITPPPQSPTEIGSFSATADLQTLVGSMPLMPSSSVAHSLSSFGTPEFADVYKNNDGTPVAHTSLASIEGGPTKLGGGVEAGNTPSSTDAHAAAKFN